MKKDLTEIIVVVDRSGSMQSMKSDAIGGFNSFLNEQKRLPGRANFTLTMFNNSWENVLDGANIHDVEELTEKTYEPHGSTALLDAVGNTINLVGGRLSKMDENDRPEKVIFVILTDGEENSSKEFGLDKIKEMITHQSEKYSWEFVYLGVGIDGISAGVSIGIDFNNSYSLNANDVHGAYRVATSSVSSYRMGTNDSNI